MFILTLFRYDTYIGAIIHFISAPGMSGRLEFPINLRTNCFSIVANILHVDTFLFLRFKSWQISRWRLQEYVVHIYWLKFAYTKLLQFLHRLFSQERLFIFIQTRRRIFRVVSKSYFRGRLTSKFETQLTFPNAEILFVYLLNLDLTFIIQI